MRLCPGVAGNGWEPPMMSAYEMLVLALAGANGGMLYWAMRPERVNDSETAGLMI